MNEKTPQLTRTDLMSGAQTITGKKAEPTTEQWSIAFTSQELAAFAASVLEFAASNLVNVRPQDPTAHMLINTSPYQMSCILLADGIRDMAPDPQPESSDESR